METIVLHTVYTIVLWSNSYMSVNDLYFRFDENNSPQSEHFPKHENDNNMLNF